MTEQRKNEIERKAFYRHIESIMRALEQCEDTHLVFQMGMEMGYMHKSLSEELSKEIEPLESEDLGDYPDTIRNQFDNMTGSINL